MTDTQAGALATRDGQGAVAPLPTNLFGARDAHAMVEAATGVANELGRIIEGRKLFVAVRGRRHVFVEGWTTLGAMLGVQPHVVSSGPLADGRGWEATAEARTLDGRCVGTADAMCSRDEEKWKDSDDYAIRSMASTRAVSKALRLPLGWIVVLAGFEATPAEEMPDELPGDRPALASQVNALVAAVEKRGLTAAEMGAAIKLRYPGKSRSRELTRKEIIELTEAVERGDDMTVVDVPDPEAPTTETPEGETAASDPSTSAEEPKPEDAGAEGKTPTEQICYSIRRAAVEPWTPSADDTALSGDAAVERMTLLQAAVEAITTLGADENDVRRLLGSSARSRKPVAGQILLMGLADLRTAVEMLENAVLEAEDAAAAQEPPADDGSPE